MPSFNPQTDIPDLTDKVCLVTGGNAGIGEAIITALAQHNPGKIYLAARSPAKAEEALVRIRATSPAAAKANIHVLDLDLASLESVKAAAARVNAEVDRLDIVHLHGGIGAVPPTVTREGYEVQFGVNYVGHALLAQLLMPKLLATSKIPGASVRIVCVSSIGHKTFAPKSGIMFDELKTDMADRGGMALYAQSMVARTLFAYKLAQMYPGIISTSIHPGAVQTNIWRGEKSVNSLLLTLVVNPLVRLFGTTATEGAKGQLWASVSKNIENGAYYEPIGKRADGKFTRDGALAEKLWEWTEKELREHGAPGWPKRA